MHYIFFGSFKIASDILAGLVRADLAPLAVIASPDKPTGKKKILTPPPAKALIQKNNWPIEILQPEKPQTIIDKLQAFKPDFFLVMGYPQILTKEILEIPKLGTLGVHPSLLPKYRGASPIQSALLANEKETGITLYLMDEKMDHGPVLANSKLPIAENETNESLEKKLAESAVQLLTKTIPEFLTGSIRPKEQNHDQASFTRKFHTLDAGVDMKNTPALEIYRKIQALNPEPGVWTMNFPGREGKRVKLLASTYSGGKLTVTKIHEAGKKPQTI